MTAIAIELGDAGLLAAGDNGLRLGPSPGYALLDGKSLLVGSEAEALARLKPRWVDNRFWDRLDTGPMPRPFPRHLSRADVAHAHLSKFWQQLLEMLGPQGGVATALLSVPGSFSVGQLGLVLGIARACGIPVTGLVDSAVAAAAGRSIPARALHLDILLHQVVWTEMEHDGLLVRRRVEVLEGRGLVELRQSWAKHIATVMVRQTRFDPLHHGAAEQTLFDRLPEWLDQLARESRVEVSLESAGKVRSVELAADSIAAACGALLAPTVEMGRSLAAAGTSPILLVSRRASGLPGLLTELSRLPVAGVEVVPSDGAVTGALDHRELIESPGKKLPLINRLPAILDLAELAAATGEAASAPPETSPTHLLLAGRASRIGAEPLWLGSAASAEGRSLVVADSMPGLSRRHCAVVRRGDRVFVEDHSRFGTYLNDQRVEGSAALRVGDRLRLGSPGVELHLILVEEHV